MLFHVDEITQPVGHSTSGSHERYKSEGRLKWEQDFDCLVKMKAWLIERAVSTNEELDKIEQDAFEEAKAAQKQAWDQLMSVLREERDDLIQLIEAKSCVCSGVSNEGRIKELLNDLKNTYSLNRKEILSTARKILRNICFSCDLPNSSKSKLQKWIALKFS